LAGELLSGEGRAGDLLVQPAQDEQRVCARE